MTNYSQEQCRGQLKSDCLTGRRFGHTTFKRKRYVADCWAIVRAFYPMATIQPHPKGVGSQNPVTDSQWVTRYSDRPAALEVRSFGTRWFCCRRAHFHAWSAEALCGSPPQISRPKLPVFFHINYCISQSRSTCFPRSRYAFKSLQEPITLTNILELNYTTEFVHQLLQSFSGSKFKSSLHQIPYKFNFSITKSSPIANFKSCDWNSDCLPSVITFVLSIVLSLELTTISDLISSRIEYLFVANPKSHVTILKDFHVHNRQRLVHSSDTPVMGRGPEQFAVVAVVIAIKWPPYTYIRSNMATVFILLTSFTLPSLHSTQIFLFSFFRLIGPLRHHPPEPSTLIKTYILVLQFIRLGRGILHLFPIFPT